MSPDQWLELLKIGGPVLLFACILLWATLRDKDRMADQLNKLNEALRLLVENNTRAMEHLGGKMDQRPCLMKKGD